MIEGPRGPIPICSNSKIREEIALYYGILVIPVGIDHDITEEQTKAKIGGGCITPLQRDENSPPLPLELSIDKAIAIKKSRQELSSFMTIDSVFLVHMLNGEVFLIHKPETDQDIERVVRLLYKASLVGAEISSFSGITVYRNGEYDTYTVELKLGKINPDADWDGLTRRIKGNNSHAAGLSTPYILNGNLVMPSDLRRVEIRRYSNKPKEGKACYVTGKIICGYDLDYSNDSTNNPITVALAVGIIPPY